MTITSKVRNFIKDSTKKGIEAAKVRASFLPQPQLHIERWKYSEPFDVWVSTLGRLKDADGKFIQSKTNNSGYLTYNGYGIHRIVMSTWKPVPGWQRLTVDHLNHNKRENTIYNLEWVSYEDNQLRAAQDKEQNIVVMLETGVPGISNPLPAESAPAEITNQICSITANKSAMVNVNNVAVSAETILDMVKHSTKLSDKTKLSYCTQIRGVMDGTIKNSISIFSGLTISAVK